MRVPDTESPCWLDGRRLPAGEVRLGIDDPTLLAGLGLFETIAVRASRPLELAPHLERLAAGARRLGLDCPADARLREYATRAAGELCGERGWIKLVLTARGQCIVFGGTFAGKDEARPASAVLLPWRRSTRDPLAGVKSLNYAQNLLGRAVARERGADEGVWLNTRGHLAEGCTTNLFVVQGRKLFTPGERDGILPGITRGVVLSAARARRLAVHEGKLRLRRLERADEAFLTSSLQGVRPLVEFERRPVGKGAPGPITLALREDLDRIRDREAAAPSAAEPTKENDRGAGVVRAAPGGET